MSAIQRVVFWATLASLAASCTSIKSGSVLEAFKGIGSGKSSPVIETYIEYAGPNTHWAGPGSLLVYLDLKDSAAGVKVQVTPAIQAGNQAGNPNAMPSIDETRELLKRLVEEMDKNDDEFSGCMLPIRVRLVRADQSVIERDGCRSETGWPGLASQIVAKFAR